MPPRRLIAASVLALVLTPTVTASAAQPRLRALNATGGTVTIAIDGRPRLANIPAVSTSARVTSRAGLRSFSVRSGTRVVVRRQVRLRDNESLTVVYVRIAGVPRLRVIREAAPDQRGARFRVANMTDGATGVDVLLGAATVARGLGPARTSVPRRVTHELTRSGTMRVAVRTADGQLIVADGPLVVATGSSATFALVRAAGRLRLLRLPYDTAPPTPIAQPQITGLPRVGNVVRCQRDAWSPTVVRRLQWTRDGTVVAGADTSSLRLSTSGHAGHIIGCTVTATANGMTTRTRTSFWLTAPPEPVIAPRVEGSGPTTGAVLTCRSDPTDWRYPPDEVIHHAWLRGDVVVASGGTYTLTLGDNAADIGCRVTAGNAGGTVVVTSANTVRLNAPPVPVEPPTLSGDQAAGSAPPVGQIVCAPGVWNNLPAFTYSFASTPPLLGSASANVLTLAPVGDDAGKTISCDVAATNAAGTATARSAPRKTRPYIFGKPTVTPTTNVATGDMLTCGTAGMFVEGETPTAMGFRWTRDGAPIVGATGQTYLAVKADELVAIDCVRWATNLVGTLGGETATAAGAAVAVAPFAGAGVPTISAASLGNGAVLTANLAGVTWNGHGPIAISLSWQRCGVPCTSVSAANAYTLGPADVGSVIRVVVSAVRNGQNAFVVSPETSVVPPMITAAAALSPGGGVVGDTLTCTGAIAGATIAYAWLRNAVVVAGGSVRQIVAADAGQSLTCRISGTNEGGSISDDAPPIVPGAFGGTAPGVSGTPIVGATLTAVPGSFNGAAMSASTWQWQRCDTSGLNCADLASATGATYLVAAADSALTVRVVETRTNGGIATVGLPSAATAVVPPVITAAAALSPGGGVVGDTLTCTGAIAGATIAYAWLRNAVVVAGGSVRQIVAADAGQSLTCRISGTNEGGSISDDAAPIVPGAFGGTAPGVTGTPVAGATLTAVPGSFNGAAMTASTWQWQQCDAGGLNCTDIATETGATYLVAAADAGFTVRVVETRTNGGIVSVNLPSAASTVVPPVITGAPSITGSTVEGDTLACSAPAVVTGATATVFDWLPGGVQGANRQITDGEAGSTITCVFTASNAGGATTASDAVTATDFVATAGPTIDNAAPVVGATLTATAGTFNGAATTASWQWQRCSGTCGDIAGATGATYVVDAADVGFTIVIVEARVNGGVAAASATSVDTGPVSP